MMSKDGRSPFGVGPLAEGGASISVESPAKPSVPNAFTPGPWSASGMYVYAEADRDAHKAKVAADRNCGATLSPVVTVIGRSDDAHVANALLIAAAPSLYEVLEEARRFVALAQVDADPEVQEEARITLPAIDTALTKARGETA